VTTYLLLAIDDDSVTAYPWELHMPCNPWPVESLVPVASGNDRNAYSTYEVSGWSIDVARMTK
jgi:hypothetical protein